MTTPMQLDLIRPGEHDVEIIDPDTGEAFEVAKAPAETIAAVLRELQGYIVDLSQRKRWLGEFMLARMDAAASWTVHARSVKVTAKSPQADTIQWDAEKLIVILDELEAEGLITKEAALRAVSPRVEFVTHAAGIKALEKLPAVAERIAAAKSTIPAGERTVRISVTS